MRRQRPRSRQPDLFSPPPVFPTWPSLPPEIQQQLRQLLARLLQSNVLPPKNPTRSREAADE